MTNMKIKSYKTNIRNSVCTLILSNNTSYNMVRANVVRFANYLTKECGNRTLAFKLAHRLDKVCVGTRRLWGTAWESETYFSVCFHKVDSNEVENRTATNIIAVKYVATKKDVQIVCSDEEGKVFSFYITNIYFAL